MEFMILSLFVCLIIPLTMSLLVLSGKARKLFIFLLIGIFMCVFASQINGWIASITNFDTYRISTTVTPVVEEIVKIIPILVLAFLFDTDRQTLLECSLMVGLGFATMENMYLLVLNANEISFILAATRGLGAAMLHATTTLIVGYGISYCKIRKKTFITGTYAMLLGAMVLHGIFNMLVQSKIFAHIGYILPTAIFVPLALIIFRQKKAAKLADSQETPE